MSPRECGRRCPSTDGVHTLCETGACIYEVMSRPPFVWFWEVVHSTSGEVVNDGCSREPIRPGPHRIHGFELRVTPLFRRGA